AAAAAICHEKAFSSSHDSCPFDRVADDRTIDEVAYRSLRSNKCGRVPPARLPAGFKSRPSTGMRNANRRAASRLADPLFHKCAAGFFGLVTKNLCRLAAFGSARRAQKLVARSQSATAASSAAMSIFFIVIIASIARLALERSELVVSSISRRGVICQEKPQRSRHQPQALSAPPSSTMAFQ